MGKDRSGILAALVLGALGVSDDDIADDWALSDPYLKEWAAHKRSLGAGDRIDELPDGFFDAPRTVMQAMLSALQSQHGSGLKLLEANGVSRQKIDGLKAAMLEN